MKKAKKIIYEQIEEYQRRGLSAEEAILKLKADHPELLPLAGHVFEDEVLANFQMGSDKMTAVRKAASDHPELYQNWKKRLASGRDSALKDLFSKDSAKAEQNIVGAKDNLSTTTDKKLEAAVAAADVSRTPSVKVKPEKVYVLKTRNHDLF